METSHVVELVLVGIGLGAVLPVLLELRGTLRAARKLVEEIAPRIEKITEEAEGTLARVHKLLPEDGGPRVDALLTSVADLATTIDQLRGQIRTYANIGAAVGPAVAAAVSAYRQTQAKQQKQAEAASAEAEAAVAAHENGHDPERPTGPAAPIGDEDHVE